MDASSAAVAVGKIPSGLFIITAALGEGKEGYLGSWVQQVSFAPLLISVAIRPGRPCHAYIKTHGRFCVNVIGHKNGGVMKPFWTPEPGGDPLAALDQFATSRGNVVLKNALAALECQVQSSFFPGDHEILIAEVVEAHLLHDDDKPLFHVRKSGLTY
jgi:flavin reductase (DIM6/NTAB) family NADH-FMN oxidoreductase RutF